MRVWILGAGALGVHVAAHLRRELHDVVIIERNRERADAALREIDCIVEIADGTSIASLRRLSVDQADCFIAVTESDEVNMVACGLVANAFGTPIKIARVRNVNYGTAISETPDLFGIDHVVSPEVETAHALLRSIEHGAVGEVVPLDKSSFTLRDIRVHAHSLAAGMSLAEMRRECEEPFIVPLIQREGEYIVPNGDTTVRPLDTLYLFSDSEAYRSFFQAIDLGANEPMHRVLILGGTLIATTVARALTEREVEGGPKEDGLRSLLAIGRRIVRRIGTRVTIVERDPARCEEIAHLIPGVQVIEADIRDERRVTSSDYRKHNLVIGATLDQESNMISALYAKSMGTSRSAAVLYHDGYARVARSLGIDVPVSLKSSMVNAIASVLHGDAVRILHSMTGSGLSLVQIEVGEASKMCGTRLRDASLPKQTLVMSIYRSGSEILPGGEHTLEAGDKAVVTARTADIAKLVKLLRGESDAVPGGKRVRS